jgi:uncharacterized protein DUF3574
LKTRRAFAAFAVVAILTSCAHAALETSIDDRLYFGRTIPSGGTVTEADWSAFLKEVVTPEFPEGFSVWRSQGQWRDPSGTIWREDGFILEVTHPDDPKFDASIRTVIDTYKKRFKQDSVLQLRERVEAHF